MKCEFLDFKKKKEIYDKIINSDIEDKELLSEIILNEIQRLESVIKDYEIAMNQVSNAIESTIFKSPKL